MTKELTALAPYMMKISEVPDRNNMIADANQPYIFIYQG